MRKTRPGSIQNTLQAAYRAVNGIENAAEDAGASVTELSYGTSMEPRNRGGLGINFVDALCRVQPDAAAVLAQHFAILAGGVYHPVAMTDRDHPSRCASAAKECGEAIAAMVEYTNSGDTEAFANARKEALEAVAELMGFIGSLPEPSAKCVPLRGVVK